MKALVFEVWDLMICETRPSSKLPESSKIRLDTGKSKTLIKRPHLDAFLKRMAELFVLIPYTTRSRGVTDKVLDALEPDEHRFSHRFFLDSCGNGIHGKTKDLRILQWPMDQVIAVDDSCSKYDSHSDNVVIIPTFSRTDLRKDRVLLDLMPFLEGLAKREVEDVRPAIRARFFENFPVAKKGNRKRMFEMVLEKNVRPVETVLVDDPPIEDKNVVDLDPDEETNVVDPVEAMETKVSDLVEAMETKVSDQDEVEEMETKVSDQDEVEEMETKVNDQDEPVETKASDREEPVEERVKKVRWLIPEMEKNREEPVEEMEKVAKKETRRNEQPSERGRIKALGRALLKVLRQPVLHPNLEMRPDGFCKLEELLELDFMTKSGVPLSSHTAAEAIKAVDKLTKKLAKMVDETGALYIGALQEPVAPNGETEQLFQKIEKSPVCVYGTSKQELEEIMKNGLTASSSNPMYLVMAVPDAEIASSMRNSSEVLITVNFQKARKDRSIEFYTSENGLIFSSGSILVKYFKQVVELPSNKVLL